MIIESQNFHSQNSIIYKSNNSLNLNTIDSTTITSKDSNINLNIKNKSILSNEIDNLSKNNNNNKISKILNIYFENEKESIENVKEYIDEIYI